MAGRLRYDAVKGSRATLAVGLLLALFALDAVLVLTHVLQPLDRTLLELLRRADQRHALAAPDWLLPLIVGVTSLGAGIARAPLTVVGGALLVWRRREAEAAALVGAVASGAVALPLLKHLFHRARPDLAWQLVVERHASFPSGHAMGSMILYPLLGWMLGRRHGQGTSMVALGVAVALGVGVTRVVLGVHWASDVIAGWLLGAAWAVTAVALLGRAPRAT